MQKALDDAINYVAECRLCAHVSASTEEHTDMLNLNKTQRREVSTAIARLPNLGGDYAARCLSALHRAALRDSQKRDIEAIAASYGLTRSSDWII